MGLEVIPIVLVVGLAMFSPSGQVSANYAGSLKEGIGMEIDYPNADEDGDYRCIYAFITTRYPKLDPQDATQITTSLVESGKTHQIDPKFTAALIARESGFNKQAVSSAGAMGLGQIKPVNFPTLNIRNPFDVKENVSGTTQYVKTLMGYWKDQSAKVALTLASYFKGPTAVSNEMGRLDDKTQAYVKDILGTYLKICASKSNSTPANPALSVN